MKAKAGIEKIIKKKELTDQQRRFAEEFVKNGRNGMLAAIEAGYSEKSARSLASQLLSKPHIVIYINELTARQIKTQPVSKKEIKSYHKKILASDPTVLFDDNGKINFKNIKNLPPEIRFGIQSIEILKAGKCKIKFYDKQTSLQELSKLEGYYKPEKILIDDFEDKSQEDILRLKAELALKKQKQETGADIE